MKKGRWCFLVVLPSFVIYMLVYLFASTRILNNFFVSYLLIFIFFNIVLQCIAYFRCRNLTDKKERLDRNGFIYFWLQITFFVLYIQMLFLRKSVDVEYEITKIIVMTGYLIVVIYKFFKDQIYKYF
jgi:hypothetical protein